MARTVRLSLTALIINRTHNNQRAAPPTLKVPQKVLLLLSEAFPPPGEQADMPQRTLQGRSVCPLFCMWT